MIPRNQLVTLVATIKSEPRISFDKQVIAVGDSRAYVSLFPKYRVGDRLKIEGKVDERGRMFNPKVEKTGEVLSIMYKVSSIRGGISDKIKSMLPSREATLVVGSVLGVDNIEQGFRDQLIATGTIHVVVVSGQNLAIVAALFLKLAKYVGRRQSLVLATLVVFAYALLTGFAPPVVRASLMVLAASLSIFLGRQTLPVLNLFVAALLILFIWPSALFEVSFQLTFAASLGIMTMGQKLSKLLERVPVFGENAAIATSAYLFTAPVIFWHFGRLSLISPIANIFVAEAVFPIMVFGFLTVGASLIFMPLAQVFAYLAYVPALYFVAVVEFFS